MKGKVLKADECWYVEIPSDLHGTYGWGDNSIYPLIVEDADVWVGKEVEVEVVGYDEDTFVPSMLKVVKPKEVMETPTLYSEIEYAIIMWSNDGTQTAGTLTREIMKLIEVKEKPEDLISLVNHVRKETGMSCTQSIKALKESKEEIGKLCSNWLRTNGSKTSENI